MRKYQIILEENHVSQIAEFDLSSYLFKEASFKRSKQVQPGQQQYNKATLVNKVTTKAIGISASLNDPHFKLSALFLQYALPVF